MSNRNVFRSPVPRTALDVTGERFTTLVDRKTHHEHFHRYLFALQFCKDRSVLDVASGEGYGTALLGSVAAEVIGVDKSAEAVRHAHINYYDRNTSFRIGEAAHLPVADQSVDVVISCETLEHFEDHDQFLVEIKRVLRPDGLLIMSSPDRDVHSGGHQIQGPHHLTELTRGEFRELIFRHFAHASFLAQSSIVGSIITMDRGASSDAGFQGFRRLDENYFECEPGLCSAMYLICVASQGSLPPVLPGAFDDRGFQSGLYGELQRRHEEMMGRDAEILNLKQEITRSASEAEKYRNATEHAVLAIERASNAVADREAQLLSLRLETERVTNELTKRNEQTNALMAERHSLSRQLKQREIQISHLSQRASTLQTQFQEQLRDHSSIRTALTKRDRQVADLEAQVLNLRNSASWKFTAPLRHLVEAAAGLLNLFYKTHIFRWSGKPLARLLSSVAVPGGAWLLPRNPLFDSSFYLEQYKDVCKSKNLWAHYLGFGADEGRNPHPLFNTSFYQVRYPDVLASGLNPLVHYFEYGASECRNPHVAFETSHYLTLYPDAHQRINPLLHFWLYGRAEGRRASPPPNALPVRADTTAETIKPNQAAKPQRDSRIQISRSGPLICVIMPTYNSPVRYLRLAIDSVRRQNYENWRLYIYDDGSTTRETIEILKHYISLDARITVQFGLTNTGVARASNSALAMAQGEYVAMLDHDDELTPDALLEVAQMLDADSSIDALYTDQAHISSDGEKAEPFFKPDWSPEFFRGVMFVGHLLVVRLELARRLGGFNPQFDRVQDFEFMLRLSEATRRIRHLPKILYYWRRIPGSVAFGGNEKGIIEGVQAAAVNGHLSRLQIPATAVPHPRLAHRLFIEPKDRIVFPTVRVLVRDVGRGAWPTECMQSVLDRTTYPNFTVSIASEMTSAGASLDRRIQVCPRQAIYDAASADEYIVWIDADLEVMTPNWLEVLLLYCEQSDVACAAPLILCDGKVWCAGLVLGMNGSLGYVMQALAPDSDGYAGSLSCSREVSAVSGECLMICGAMFRDLGGRVKYYSTSVFDGADLALRALAAQRRNIVTPRAVVRRTHQSPAHAPKLDEELFLDRWKEWIEKGDPCYNPTFSLNAPGYFVRAGAASGNR